MTPAAMARLHAAAFTRSRPWTEAEFADLLDGPGTFAAGDDRAFVLARVIAGEAELLTIATDPALQRQGLARTLMDEWQALAMARGATQAFLEVAADNDAARALYAACAYAEAGRRKGYYHRSDGSRVDALVMTRAL
ncbi:GNAT family N-acetyltransferase [Chachezhania sediminis]|uniref:GNAT family N-acetyltransferase n=1 Tax=Chachezhania sediminis TaxID=2599291 RepID=UPI001E32019C|nr:GNAT family N-acetyltransferase [Chachezhania sediminis]